MPNDRDLRNPFMFFWCVMTIPPIPIKIWLFVLGLTNTLAGPFVAFSRPFNFDAFIIIVLWAGVGIGMPTVYSFYGFVKLLGIVHIILWTPLVPYLIIRLSVNNGIDPSSLFGVYCIVLIIIDSISLILDYIDVYKYWQGERDEIEAPVPAGKPMANTKQAEREREEREAAEAAKSAPAAGGDTNV